ncbi:MAG: 5'-nucleotidase C-terminal domain-containing protein [Elainellaceae cyanobacterium]
MFELQLLHATDQEAASAALIDAPNLSAVLNALEDDFENTLILSSGDLWLPGLFYSASAEIYGFTDEEGEFEGVPGIADVLINNALGLQAAAFGNHEFDQGTGAIQALLSANPDITGPGIGEGGYQGTAFPYLSANLDFSNDPNLADLVVEDGQDASTLANGIANSAIATVNGEKIGLVGATTPTLASISSPGEDVIVNPANAEDFDALAAIIQAEVNALLAANPDLNKVVLLSHMQVLGIEVDELAPRLTGVDIIVAGGSDTILADESDRLRDGDEPGGPYPIFRTAADGNPIAIVNTDGQYLYVGRLVVTFDENGIILEDSIDPAISGAYATDAQGVADLGAEDLVDPVITEVIAALNEVVAEKEENLFGVTDVFLNGRRTGGGLDGVRTQETNLGNLTADANLWYGQQFDPTVAISIKNGGGIRESIGSVVTPPGATEPVRLPPEASPVFDKPEGGITQTDVESVLAFNNGLTVVTATPAELKDILEHTVSGATLETIDDDFGSFGQVSGLEFSFDIGFQPRELDPITEEEITDGERVRSLALVDETGEITDVVVENGEIQGDPDRTFRLITLNFLADGGSNYPIPQVDRVDLVDLGAPVLPNEAATFAETGSEQDALAEYLAAFFPGDEDPTTPAFDMVDTPREEDERIQNLLFREDTVLGDAPGESPVEPPIEPAPEPINLDFDGADLAAGAIVSDQFEGVVISSADEGKPAMLFDSENPTGGDFDLQSDDLGLVLIISEDGDSSDPDDNARGGTLSFDFASGVSLESVDILDNEEDESFITLYGEDDATVLNVVQIAAGVNNGLQTVSLGAVSDSLVGRMDVTFENSGAVANVLYAEEAIA